MHLLKTVMIGRIMALGHIPPQGMDTSRQDMLYGKSQPRKALTTGKNYVESGSALRQGSSQSKGCLKAAATAHDYNCYIKKWIDVVYRHKLSQRKILSRISKYDNQITQPQVGEKYLNSIIK